MRKFHEHQNAAFAETGRLVLALVLAIVGTIVLSAGAITYVLAVFMYMQGVAPEEHSGFLYGIFGVTTAISAVIVAVGTFLKLHQLREGGAVIAVDLGGRPLEPEQSTHERRLLNIVEEMSIASGIPVPEVYLLPQDQGINAFAAGYHPHQAVLGITRGAVEHLSRDELQAVVAHEFSHILNGDMRLNLRMIGWLHGVLAITIVAEHLIETGKEWTNNSYRRSHDGVGLIILGAALWPVGLIGALMAMLVKSATSRQREYLADAFAVQFTRHPTALADAFKRLAGHVQGSHVRSANALEASHLFLASGCGNLLSGMLASHPPLEERIRRLDPDWDGVPVFADVPEDEGLESAFGPALGLVGSSKKSQMQHMESANEERESVEELDDNEYARYVTESLPADVLRVSELPGGAVLIIAAVWIAQDKGFRGLTELSTQRAEQVVPLVELLRKLDKAQQLILFDAALSKIESCANERAEVRQLLDALGPLCKPGNEFHWMWQEALGYAVAPTESPKPRYAKIEQVGRAVQYLLSYFCHQSNSGVMAGFAFQRGLASLGLEHAEFLEEEELDWEGMLTSVDLVAQLAPIPRRKVLLACVATVSADQEVGPEEACLLRALCLRLGYGPTNLLAGQPLAPGS